MKVLLSIKPDYANLIFTGSKKFEFRKTIFKREITSVVVYSTMPVGKIIGEFKVARILNDDPNIVWNKTKNHAGVKEHFFQEYFFGRKTAYAIEIEDAKLYEEPIDPYEQIENFFPPQSFRYVTEGIR